MISFFSEDVSMPFKDVDKISNWLNLVIQAENCIPGDLNIVFTSDEYLLDMNKKYLNHDYFTDVITFDYRENNIISGDIFISIDRIEENSKSFGVTFDIELFRIIVHGTLHILGYKDKEKKDKNLMTKLENKYLQLL